MNLNLTENTLHEGKLKERRVNLYNSVKVGKIWLKEGKYQES